MATSPSSRNTAEGGAKNLTKKVTFVLESGVAPAEIRRESEVLEECFQIVHINDFTQTTVKVEETKFESNGSIETMPICPASHGGLLDYPKVTSKCIGLIVTKWDHCYQLVMDESNNKPNLGQTR